MFSDQAAAAPSEKVNSQKENIGILSSNNWSAANTSVMSKILAPGQNNTAGDIQPAALMDITNTASDQQPVSQTNWSMDVHDDLDNEGAFMHMCEEELTGASDLENLRGARNRLWGAEIDQRFDSAVFGHVEGVHLQVPMPVTAIVAKHKSTAANIAASARAATHANTVTDVACNMARRVTTSTHLANADVLARFIHGSTRAPGQLYSWVTSGFSSPGVSSGSDNANTASYFSIHDQSVFRPSVCGTPLSTLPTQMGTPLTSLSPALYSTPPTSYNSSPNASSTNVASTEHGTMDPGDYQTMTGGTLFERGPDGVVVSVAPFSVDAAGRENGQVARIQDNDEDGYEMVFVMDGEATPSQNPRGQDQDVMDGTFCVLDAVPSINTGP
ncbi:hypothetical protein SPBR_00742 [Sporothrix brasiliensis 5110]|uniref:Uncharacterized protein n=1 Tax=Sporothrix brasiliensis 5110 TaxID=1398154 RepID=A0A0C2IUV0_9PEZI|nr:uncharacterized protein SPBR_00742 [Sporothrix brasiliensis 5110]KIH90570.1 hypothetical protein SPBR_00742 [Sporothrix brasiliensis 5110]